MAVSLPHQSHDPVAGGFFTQAHFTDANYAARWDGADWFPLGDGVTVGVHAMTIYNDDLIVGGPLMRAGGQPTPRIARWDGNGWSDMDGGVSGRVNALAVRDASLNVGGNFTAAGGAPAARQPAPHDLRRTLYAAPTARDRRGIHFE